MTLPATLANGRPSQFFFIRRWRCVGAGVVAVSVAVELLIIGGFESGVVITSVSVVTTGAVVVAVSELVAT